MSQIESEVVWLQAIAHTCEAEHGVKLPEYSDEGLTAYLEKVRHIVSKLQWEVSSECKIGIFSFLKINMYRDLKDNAKTILSNRNVRLLLGERDLETILSDFRDDSDSTSVHVKDPLIQLHSVVDADSSQI